MSVPVRTMAEFREGLQVVLKEYRINAALNEADYLLFELRICMLALDYADGFYRDAFRMMK